MKMTIRAILSLATSAAAIGCASALAADISAGIEAEPALQLSAERSIFLGAGVGFEPLYEGSKEYRAYPFPVFSYDSGSPAPSRFEFRSLDDFRLHALKMGNFSIGPIAGYRFGRDEADSNRLRGLGDVDGGLVLGGFLSYGIAASDNVTWSADIGLSSQVTGDAFEESRFADVVLPVSVRDRLGDGYGYGFEMDFGLSNEIAVNDRLKISSRVGATYASDDYLSTYFGIGAAQAASATALGNSIAEFNADGGLKNAYVTGNATYGLTERIQLRTGLGYSRLLNDAADSPITESADQFSGSLGAAYRFKF